jgi:Protein of unknown function (DUF2992)
MKREMLHPPMVQPFDEVNMGAFYLYFDGQKWVGLATRLRNTQSEAARVVFGPEPTSPELDRWCLDFFAFLEYRSVESIAMEPPDMARNPKRRARQTSSVESRRLTASREIARQLLERNKKEGRAMSRAQEEAREQLKYNQAAEKRKRRHRGK